MNFYEQQKADPLGQTSEQVTNKINELYDYMIKFKK